MKVRIGKIKLDPNERRVGNFVLRDEESHVKVMDINQIFTHRASKRTPVGAFLKHAFDDLADGQTHDGIARWLAVIFTVFSTIPDVEFLSGVFDASKACMERHPEAYGMPATAGTDAENEQAETEMKEMAEFEEGVKNLPDEPAPAESES